MIEALTQRIVRFIEIHNDRKQVSRDVMVFALQSLLTNLLTIVLSLLIALLLGTLRETAMVLVAVAVLRNLTGGFHFKSATLCVVVSTLIVVLIPFVPIDKITGLVLTIISVILVLLFAPSDLKGHTRISDRGLQIMKMAGLLVVCSNLVLQSPLLALSFFSVGLSLIPWKGGTKHA